MKTLGLWTLFRKKEAEFREMQQIQKTDTDAGKKCLQFFELFIIL